MILRVAFDMPHRQPFDYFGIENEPLPAVGTRVLATIGNAHRIGVVMEIAQTSTVPLMKIRKIEAVLDQGQPIISSAIVDLILHAAQASFLPVGKLTFAALPPAVRKRTKDLDLAVPAKRQPLTATPDLDLSGQQRRTLNDLFLDKGTFAAHLVTGSPGSGKSAVCLAAVSTIITQGQTCLLLVPEIQTVAHWQATLAKHNPEASIVAVHSELSASARLAAWWEAMHGAHHVVIGTRSAVFTPLVELGLVVIVNENDPLYRAELGLSYSARDLGAQRARIASCPVLMSAATASLELRYAAQNQRVNMMVLPRPANIPKPRVEIVDIANRRLFGGVSIELENSLRQELQRGGLSVILINRKGRGGTQFCASCRALLRCPKCRNLLVQDSELACLCRRCRYSRTMPKSCPACGSTEFTTIRPGSVRVAESLATRIPEAHILRVDADADRQQINEQLAVGEIDIVVGTTLLLGLNLKPSTCAISDADSFLYGNNYRAAEHLLDILTKLTTSTREVNLIVQTRFAQHHVHEALRRGSYDTFAFAELVERKAAGLPPFRRLALLWVEGENQDQVARIIGAARHLASNCLDHSIFVMEPVPSPLSKETQRLQLLVSSPNRTILQQGLQDWAQALDDYHIPKSVTWGIEMDPEQW